jgi:hypothetical protein
MQAIISACMPHREGESKKRLSINRYINFCDKLQELFSFFFSALAGQPGDTSQTEFQAMQI